MSRVLTAKEICERALRVINEFPVSESAAEGEPLREAMYWLDLLLAETVGTEFVFSRQTETLTMDITNGTQSYDFFTTLGDELPEDRIQYITDAYVEDEDGNRTPVEIVNQKKFEDVSRTDETGRPCWLFIDQVAAPTLRIFPTPHEDDETEYSLKLICQQYAPNVSPAGVTGTQPSGSVLHDMGQAWQRWLVWQLSHDLGCGPIVKLPDASLQRLERNAAMSKQRLLAYENRTHETTPPIGEAWGYQ